MLVTEKQAYAALSSAPKKIIQPRRETMKEKTDKATRSAFTMNPENIVFIIVCAAAIAIIARLACA